MFCEKCGHELKESHKFCTECGYSNIEDASPKVASAASHLYQKWWLRLAKVIYIFLYIPLPFAVVLAWTENDPYSYYSSYSHQYYNYGSYGQAFLYSILLLFVWIIILRLVKITFLYIAFAQKPQWKKEFKKFF